MGRLSSAQFDVRQRRPDFIVQLQINENTTARLLAYRDVGSAVSGGGFMVTDDEGRRAPAQSAGVGLGLGLMLNASIHNVGFNSVPVPSTIQENSDANGF